jgi:hypothetical protein
VATKKTTGTNGTVNRIEEFIGQDKHVTIAPPNYQVAEIRVVGTAPLVQNKFSAKALQQIRDTQEAGSQAKKGKKREAKDFKAAFEGACYRGPKGEYGIPAPAFRAAMIDACRMVDFAMTRAKMSVFVVADFVSDDGTPLVRLDAGDPEYTELPVRNKSGVVDIRARPMWREWAVTLRVRFNADQFSLTDVANLLAHAGVGVGVGEGRPYSKDSTGCGWGTFELAQTD